MAALAAATPAGAAALQCQPYGVTTARYDVYGVACVLPLLCVAGAAWDLDRLAGDRLPHRSRGDVVAALEAVLAPGPRRSDGLPGYVPMTAPDATRAHEIAAQGTVDPSESRGERGQRITWREMTSFRERTEGRFTFRSSTWRAHEEPPPRYRPAKSGRNVGGPTRSVLSAVARDLLGQPGHRVSQTYGVSRFDHPDSSRGRTMRREGRALLAALGAWPWACARAGKLPDDWRSRAEFADRLAQWASATMLDGKR